MDETAETIRIMRQVELEVEHRLVGHHPAVNDCKICRAHRCDSTPLHTLNGRIRELWTVDVASH